MTDHDAKPSEPPGRLLSKANSQLDDLGSVPPSGPALPSLLIVGDQLYLTHGCSAIISALRGHRMTSQLDTDVNANTNAMCHVNVMIQKRSSSSKA